MAEDFEPTSPAGTPRPTPMMDMDEGEGSNNTPYRSSSGQGIGGGEESEVSVPKATVFKIITETLPSGIQCPVETREFILECCTEFIHLLSSEANEVCEKAGRKTIAPEHVVDALKNLGFGSYVEEVMQVYEEACEQAKEKEKARGSGRLENTGLTEEELLRQQEELFEQARRKFLASNSNAVAENTNKEEAPSPVSTPTASTTSHSATTTDK